MQLPRNTIISITIVLVYFCSNGLADSLLDTLESMESALDKILLLVDNVDGNGNTALNPRNGRTRFKRQERSKYVATSKVPLIKVIRLELQMLKNFFTDGNDIGGKHAMSHNVPKTTVRMFIEQILDYFFPEIGIDAPPDRSRQI